MGTAWNLLHNSLVSFTFSPVCPSQSPWPLWKRGSTAMHCSSCAVDRLEMPSFRGSKNLIRSVFSELAVVLHFWFKFTDVLFTYRPLENAVKLESGRTCSLQFIVPETRCWFDFLYKRQAALQDSFWYFFFLPLKIVLEASVLLIL